MATTAMVQVPSYSVDRSGISVVTTTRSAANPRLGAVYNPVNLAAGVPIYFHPLGDDNFVGIFSRRWTDATVSTTNPALYSAYSEETTPSWAMISGIGTMAPFGGSFVVPTGMTLTSRVVEGGCSRSTNYLYLLNTVVSSGVTSAAVQHFSVSHDNLPTLLAEEVVPTATVDGQDILFNRGIYFAPPNLVLIGAKADDNAVYFARKQWSRIGAPGTGVGVSSEWFFQTDKGWSTDTAEIASATTTLGDVLTTVGPCSAISYRQQTEANRILLSTVTANGAVRTAQLYVSKGLQWQPGNSLPLGNFGSSYLGGLNLQSSLASADENGLSPSFPYVISQYATDNGEEGISTTWNLARVSGGFQRALENAVEITAAPTVSASMGQPFQTTSLAATATLSASGQRGHPVGSTAVSVTAAVSGSVTRTVPPEVNTNRTNQAVPSGATGCYVTLIGAGGAGGNGTTGSTSGGGGSGGGGGGRIDRVFIPVASLGATYSVTVGTGGASAQAGGTASTFSSASVSLSAGGGGGGQNGKTSGTATGGTAGTCSVSGISATSHSGTAGGSSEASSDSNPGGVGTNDTTNDVGCGGGGGGGQGSTGVNNGGKGGDSNTITGGAGGTSGGFNGGTPSNAADTHGGAGGGGGAGQYNHVGGNGGNGGNYGGGGGGGGTSWNQAVGAAGLGGAGHTLVEWVGDF